jgi:hypothetical protein
LSIRGATWSRKRYPAGLIRARSIKGHASTVPNACYAHEPFDDSLAISPSCRYTFWRLCIPQIVFSPIWIHCAESKIGLIPWHYLPKLAVGWKREPTGNAAGLTRRGDRLGGHRGNGDDERCAI